MDKKNVLFISDIDRTLIFPKRFARDGDVCIEWTKSGEELNYINPCNLKKLIELSHKIKLVFITIRSKDQYERIRWPDNLDIHSVLLCFGNDIYFSQELNETIWINNRTYGLRSYKDLVCDAFEWLNRQHCFKKCAVGEESFISAKFNQDVSDFYKNQLQEDLYCDFLMESYVVEDRLYAVPMNNTKGNAALNLAKQLQPEAIIVAGDSNPDVPMFAYADCAIYPSNLFGQAHAKNAYTKKLLNEYGKEPLTKYAGAINCVFSPDTCVAGFTDYVIEEVTCFLEKQLGIK